MSYWINPEINLGLIKAGSAKKVVYKALENIPAIKQIIPYCGCTTTKFDTKTKELHIKYSNGAMAPQVVGLQSVNKRIDIVYENGSQETLTLKAIKIR